VPGAPHYIRWELRRQWRRGENRRQKDPARSIRSYHPRSPGVEQTHMSTEKFNLDIHKILTLLPHRYPILLVDRVLELEPHKSIKALKNVSINEPYFVGHFPQRPVMPGVLILEALAQTAALLTFSEAPNDPEKTLYYFVGIDGARFKRVVEPGDQLILHASFERYMRGIWKFKARAEVDGVTAAEADLMCTVKPTGD
jgi:3-hydroxyacyl-[acyl-carrier-protein] dehydratase